MKVFMRSCCHYVTLSAMLLGCLGCSEIPFASPAVEPVESLNDQPATDSAAPLVSLAEAELAADADREEAQRGQVPTRIGELFAKVLPTLDKARELVDRHADLPDKSRLPFTPDKQSNSADLNDLLDQAIEMLGVSEVTDYRRQIREAQEAISASHDNIADYQRQRVSAPWAKDQGQLEKLNPFTLSKEAIDQRIDDEQAEIQQRQKQLVELKRSFTDELSKIGVEVDDEGVESLLSSVSGDDIVTMAVVFDNIKHLTIQLQQLTEESGEALATAKRYYGMYVVMIQVMDRIQDTFVRDIKEEHIPKLGEFARQADQNIAQAHALIDADRGDTQTLQANIAANQLTRETARLYVRYLQQNAELIAAENKLAQKNLATAMNTYNTVKLSSDVAALMHTGRRDFDTLMRLKLPALREFNNDAIRKEFQRMTFELRAGS